MIEQDGKQSGIDLDHITDVTEVYFVSHTCLAVQDLFWGTPFRVHDIAVDT